MFEGLRRWVLRIARVPEAPQPPAGASASVRVFRAGRNHFRIRLLHWFGAQAATLLGILLSLAFLAEVKDGLNASAPTPSSTAVVGASEGGEMAPPAEPARSMRWLSRINGPRQAIERTPAGIVPFVIVAEVIGITIFLIQLPLTFAAVRLDWELRWYIVTDRSLRIRTGIWNLQESTMSFANLQQVEVTQGPVQRLLGLADVLVQSAGGGGAEPGKKSDTPSLHQGVFAGVENAFEIRNLILERLRQFRAAGLGDPDDVSEPGGATAEPHPATGAVVLAAADDVRREIKTLRAALTAGATSNG